METGLISRKETYDILEKYARELSVDQITALPYLAAGVEARRVADIVGVAPATVYKWRNEHPEFIAALTELKSDKLTTHNETLNQIAHRAYDVLWEIVSQDYAEADEKERNRIAQAAKFIVEKVHGSTIHTTVSHEIIDPSISIAEHSIDILAKRVHELSVEQEKNLALKDEFVAEDADFRYAFHPDTTFGVLNTDNDAKKYQCHVCGAWTADLATHVEKAHSVSVMEYSEMTGVEVPDNG